MDSALAQMPIVRKFHISVPFRMGHHRSVAFGLEPFQHVQKVERRYICRCFHQHDVIAHDHQVSFTQSCFKLAVKHILRCEIQLDRSLICFLQLRKPLSESLCFIRHIVHDVRCAPEFPYSDGFHICKNLERFRNGPDSVVDSREEMRVTVTETLQHTAFQKRCLLISEYAEESHKCQSLVLVSVAVTISIAVSVAISTSAISIFLGKKFNAVDDHCHVLVFSVSVKFFDVWKA